MFSDLCAMLVGVQDKIVSFDLFEQKFVCDLNACKGACCVEGTGGAPITTSEIEELEENYERIKPFMTPEGIEAVEKDGVFYMEYQDDFSVTLVNEGACAFVAYDENGITKCAIEHAHKAGESTFLKPISCHLYPIRVNKSEHMEALNYHPWEVCKPACACGSKLNIKVFNFLKTPLIRAYGQDFYDELVEVEKELRAEGHLKKE